VGQQSLTSRDVTFSKLKYLYISHEHGSGQILTCFDNLSRLSVSKQQVKRDILRRRENLRSSLQNSIHIVCSTSNSYLYIANTNLEFHLRDALYILSCTARCKCLNVVDFEHWKCITGHHFIYSGDRWYTKTSEFYSQKWIKNKTYRGQEKYPP
jgi:hypothetical protein